MLPLKKSLSSILLCMYLDNYLLLLLWKTTTYLPKIIVLKIVLELKIIVSEWILDNYRHKSVADRGVRGE
jgi:hypothetical protein